MRTRISQQHMCNSPKPETTNMPISKNIWTANICKQHGRTSQTSQGMKSPHTKENPPNHSSNSTNTSFLYYFPFIEGGRFVSGRSELTSSGNKPSVIWMLATWVDSLYEIPWAMCFDLDAFLYVCIILIMQFLEISGRAHKEFCKPKNSIWVCYCYPPVL